MPSENRFWRGLAKSGYLWIWTKLLTLPEWTGHFPLFLDKSVSICKLHFANRLQIYAHIWWFPCVSVPFWSCPTDFDHQKNVYFRSNSGSIWVHLVCTVIWLRVYNNGTTASPRNNVGDKISLAGFDMTGFDLIAQKCCKYIHVRQNNTVTTYWLPVERNKMSSLPSTVTKIANRSTPASRTLTGCVQCW